MNRKLSLLLTLIMLASALLGGCAGAPAAGAPAAQARDTLTIAYTDEPDSLYCFGTTINMAEKMCANIYATLLKFDENYNIIPYVAKEWSISEDGKVYTFKLRDDVYFHDGSHMTSADVLFSFETAKASAYSAFYLETAESFRAVDDYTFEITLHAPYSPFLNMLCEPFLGIINEKSLTELGEKFAQAPIGSGPYKVVEWAAGTKLTLVAFDKFFEGEPPIKNIVVKFIPDPSTKLISLENGEVDVADSIETNNIAAVESNKDLVMYKTASTKYGYMGLNNQGDKFKDNVKYRQAINYAINKDAIIQIAQDGMATPAVCTISDQTFGFPKNMVGYTYDPEKAAALVAECDSLEPFDIMCSTAVSKKIAEAIQADLAKVGIVANVAMLERGGFFDALAKCNFDAFISSWADSLMDVDSVVAMRYDSSFVGDPGNYDWIIDEKIDQYMDDGRKEGDPEKRQAIYEEFFQYVSDQAVEVPLFYYTSSIAASTAVKGIKPMATGIHYYNDWSF